MMGAKNILIAAGGTGGHIFPAEALAETLKRRGHHVYFATDVRGLRFVKNFPAHEVKLIDGATVFSKSPISLVKALYKIMRGVVQSVVYIRAKKIDIVVGFGGYPSFAPMMAGKLCGKPSVLHEQNAVLGRANKLLAKFSQRVALSFPKTKFAEAIGDKAVFIGNPLRSIVHELKDTQYKPYIIGEKFNLVVFGGSQGAQVFNDILPAAMMKLPDDVRGKINLVQQVRQDSVERLIKLYDELNMDAIIAPFFGDMPKLIANSHLVIGRAGATTVAELCYIGIPSILVPLPGSLDGDQANNAKNIADIGGGWLCKQDEFTADYLAGKIQDWMKASEPLTQAAQNAKNLGQPKAAENLADLVEKYIG
ncbi:MAG: undecaprenyldiphospho-muramoylpentapeptide beta-N-acetylglucosaminyltransferase [Alphaproteobacteria bacterium]|nr:undecaprenyldiphospho-muramoylpentapeptide beta-N-acetylglucosaminyltransferase [Alphaproteobacteria bacterium]